MTAPLRIGILGAARIADEGIVAPARTLAVDASMRVELAYPGGVTGRCVRDMDAHAC